MHARYNNDNKWNSVILKFRQNGVFIAHLSASGEIAELRNRGYSADRAQQTLAGRFARKKAAHQDGSNAERGRSTFLADLHVARRPGIDNVLDVAHGERLERGVRVTLTPNLAAVSTSACALCLMNSTRSSSGQSDMFMMLLSL